MLSESDSLNIRDGAITRIYLNSLSTYKKDLQSKHIKSKNVNAIFKHLWKEEVTIHSARISTFSSSQLWKMYKSTMCVLIYTVNQGILFLTKTLEINGFVDREVVAFVSNNYIQINYKK